MPAASQPLLPRGVPFCPPRLLAHPPRKLDPRRRTTWLWWRRAAMHAALRWRSLRATARCWAACALWTAWLRPWPTAQVRGGQRGLAAERVGTARVRVVAACCRLQASPLLLLLLLGELDSALAAPSCRPPVPAGNRLRRQHRLHEAGGGGPPRVCLAAPAAGALPGGGARPAGAAARPAGGARAGAGWRGWRRRWAGSRNRVANGDGRGGGSSSRWHHRLSLWPRGERASGGGAGAVQPRVRHPLWCARRPAQQHVCSWWRQRAVRACEHA